MIQKLYFKELVENEIYSRRPKKMKERKEEEQKMDILRMANTSEFYHFFSVAIFFLEGKKKFKNDDISKNKTYSTIKRR